MSITEYQIGKHTVIIHDPAETPEAKAARQQRLEKACVRFMRECEKDFGKEKEKCLRNFL